MTGVWNTENRPKLAARAQGSTAADAAMATSSHGLPLSTASTAEPISTPSSVPAPRCTARPNTDPRSGLSTMATVSSTQ